MSKRFTDTEKWKDPWFRKLSPSHKAIWEFLRDSVDAAGFWKVDLEYMQFHVDVYNCPNSYPEKKSILIAFNEGKERIRDHGEHWQILDFISFQYGRLREEVKPHRPILALLEKYQNKGYLNGINTVEEKETDKEKVKIGGVGDFHLFWQSYPKKRSKGQAESTWAKIKPDELLTKRIFSALECAKTSADWTKDGGKFIPYPATWLNAKGWEDEQEISVGVKRAKKPDPKCSACGGTGRLEKSNCWCWG